MLSLHGPDVRLNYRVHLYQDWIESITFDKEDMKVGEWTFSYPASDEADPHRLTAAPSLPSRRRQTPALHSLWLVHLVEGNLVE